MLAAESAANGYSDCTLYCEEMRDRELKCIYQNECRKRDKLLCLLEQMERLRRDLNAGGNKNEDTTSNKIGSNIVPIEANEDVEESIYGEFDDFSVGVSDFLDSDLMISDASDTVTHDAPVLAENRNDADQSQGNPKNENLQTLADPSKFIDRKKKLNRRFYSLMSPVEKEIEDQLDVLDRYAEIRENRPINNFVMKYPTRFQLEAVNQNSALSEIILNLRKESKIDWNRELLNILEIIKNESIESGQINFYNELCDVKVNGEDSFTIFICDALTVVQKNIFKSFDCDRLIFYKNILIDLYELNRRGKR